MQSWALGAIDPGPLAPEARIMPLDQQASYNNKMRT